jgi:hypothetical protein
MPLLQPHLQNLKDPGRFHDCVLRDYEPGNHDSRGKIFNLKKTKNCAKVFDVKIKSESVLICRKISNDLENSFTVSQKVKHRIIT